MALQQRMGVSPSFLSHLEQGLAPTLNRLIAKWMNEENLTYQQFFIHIRWGYKNIFIDPRSVGIPNINRDGIIPPNLYLSGIIPACISVVLNTSVLCAQPITFQSSHLCWKYTALPKIPLNKNFHIAWVQINTATFLKCLKIIS